jgi:hypothetical protein
MDKVIVPSSGLARKTGRRHAKGLQLLSSISTRMRSFIKTDRLEDSDVENICTLGRPLTSNETGHHLATERHQKSLMMFGGCNKNPETVRRTLRKHHLRFGRRDGQRRIISQHHQPAASNNQSLPISTLSALSVVGTRVLMPPIPPALL